MRGGGGGLDRGGGDGWARFFRWIDDEKMHVQGERPMYAEK